MAEPVKAKVIVATGTRNDLVDVRDELEQEINNFLSSKPKAEIIETALESDLVLPNSAAMVVIYYREKA